MNTTKQQFIHQVERLEDLFSKQYEIIDILDKVVGTDGELIQSIYDLQCESVKALAMVVNDCDDWLEWYFFESCTSAVSQDGLDYEITTPEELVEFCGWFKEN